MACGLPEGDLECVVALTLANFFGWHAGSVFSVLFISVKLGPDKRGYPTIEFGTSVFKASPLYPVRRLALQDLLGLFKVVCAFVVACKGQLGQEFSYGPVALTRGQAATWLTSGGCRVKQTFGLHLPLESHALKIRAASCLYALHLAPHKINMRVGWSSGSNSLLHLHGLLTRHMSCARAWYRCHMAVHTASTLEVHTDHIRSWSLDIHSEINITTGFGSKSKTALFNTYYYFVGLLFVVAASPVMTRTSVLLGTS